MKKVRFLAYGTLRKGSYNYDRFRKTYDEFNHVETGTLENFAMWSLGPYPGGYPIEGKETVVDVIECSQEAFDMLALMEVGAGYSRSTAIYKGEEYPIFLYRKPSAAVKLLNDWIEHEKN